MNIALTLVSSDTHTHLFCMYLSVSHSQVCFCVTYTVGT